VRRGPRIVAMIAVHDQAPFSVADRLSDPTVLTQLGDRLLEVRLLAVRPVARRSRVVLALLWALYRYATAANYTHLLISGVREQLPLYQRFGFQALGPAVRQGAAWFVPMALPLAALSGAMRAVADRWERQLGLAPLGFGREPLALLPGPVQIAERTRAALAAAPVSHRDPAFVERFEAVRETLAALVGRSDRPALLSGSGTTANDAIALHLAANRTLRRGLILVNGEFGERLARQAQRAGLCCARQDFDWGAAYDLERVADCFRRGGIDWVWAVHSESSTGVLNDLAGLCALGRAHGVRVCVDCVSSLGGVPLDLSDVYMASAASGKCLAAYAGLAIVYASAEAWSAVRGVPDTLDLAAASAARGPRHTLASGLLASLDIALDEYRTPKRAAARYASQDALGRYVRRELGRLGIVPLAADEVASPVITTFRPPGGTPDEFALLCRAFGYRINAVSPYLRERGLVQIATMGDLTSVQLAPLFEQLGVWLARVRQAAGA